MNREVQYTLLFLQRVPEDTKAAGYRTWLGFYKGFAGKLGWSAEELVQQANDFSQIIGTDLNVLHTIGSLW